MGSAPEGTMCVYCNEEEAGYIPDGLLGFTCGTCMDDCATHGDGFIDRKRMDRYLHSLRAVTGDRQHPFHQLFLDRDPRNGQGYNLAPFLIWTNEWYRPSPAWAAVAAHDDDATVQESDDDASSLLWEDRWEVVMAAELAYRPMLQGRSERQPTWTIDRTLRHWHETAYLGLRTPHGRTVLVSATQEIMRARYATLQAEEGMRCALEDLRLAHTTLLQAQRRYNQAREHERQYDSGVSGGVRLWPFPGLEPQLRLAERYESAWAILAWMTAHGPIGNLPARNELAQYYHDQLSHWGRFTNGLYPGGPHWSEDEAEEDWENDVDPHNPTLMEHYLADTRGHY